MLCYWTFCYLRFLNSYKCTSSLKSFLFKCQVTMSTVGVQKVCTLGKFFKHTNNWCSSPSLTSVTAVEIYFALCVTIITWAWVFICLIVFWCIVLLHQIHHQNRLKEAEHHQSKNPNAVDRWGEQGASLRWTNNCSLSQYVLLLLILSAVQ